MPQAASSNFSFYGIVFISACRALRLVQASGVAPTVKGPGYGQTQPGHDATGGFRPVLNAGPDLSEVTQPGLGQGNTFVTSWDDMRKK